MNYKSVLMITIILSVTTSLMAADNSQEQSSNTKPAAVVEATNDLTFIPAKITIKSGETVQWKNTSLMVHTVTCDSALAARLSDVALPAGAKPFNSGYLKPGITFEHTFTVPGVYRYFCILHERNDMVGEIIVKPH
jgi:plastocyanin